MKRLFLAGALIAAVFLPPPAAAQTFKALVTSFTADGKVLELNIPTSKDGEFIVVFWGNANPLQTYMLRARAGVHCYEMRHLPSWTGKIAALGVNLSEASGQVKSPTWFDEIDMFLEPERIGLGTVNFLVGHRLLGWTWNAALVFVLLTSALYCRLFRKMSAISSLALGFLMSWAVMDARAVYDHVAVISQTETNHPGAHLLNDAEKFSDGASKLIVGASWGRKLPDGVPAHLVSYRLAEHRYVPDGSNKPPDFWVTQDADQTRAIWKYENFNLVKEPRP